MSVIEPLLNFTIYHDYFEKYLPDIFLIRSEMDIRKLLGGPRFPFIQKNDNTWTMFGDPNTFSDLLSESPEGMILEFWIEVKDADFLYYTTSMTPDTENDNEIQILREAPYKSLSKVTIRITPQLSGKSIPIEKGIYFTSPEKYWKFIIIPRNQEDREIGLEDMTGNLVFTKTAQAQWMDQKIYLITSASPIKLKDPRYASNPPDINLFERQEYGKKALLKHIPLPEPGRFLVKELQRDNEILQILYI